MPNFKWTSTLVPDTRLHLQQTSETPLGWEAAGIRDGQLSQDNKASVTATGNFEELDCQMIKQSISWLEKKPYELT